jgi:hypothetical protein
MKTNKLLLVAIAVMCMFSVTAQDIIPIDSTHLLSRSQKFALKYAKNPKNIFGDDNSVYLPLEINNIIGDTTDTKLVSVAKWEDAYFVNNKEYRAMLIIPLEAEVKTEKIYSEMNVIYDHEGNVHRLVLSNFAVGKDTIQEKVLVKSNNSGMFVGATIYNSKDEVIAEVEGKYKNYSITDYFGNPPELKKNSGNIIIPQGLRIPSASWERVNIGNRYKWSEKWTDLKH